MSVRYSKDFKSNIHIPLQKSSESESVKEIRRLNQMLKERDKEIEFLKKAAAFFAKEMD